MPPNGDRQLTSIEQDDVFTSIRKRICSAYLTTVRRQRQNWTKQIATDSSKGHFKEGLEAHNVHDLTHWQHDLEAARTALLESWRSDTEA